MNDRELVKLGRRLRIRAGQKVAVVNASPECALITPADDGSNPDDADAVIGFAIQRAHLCLLGSVYAAARDGRLAWLGYPKPGRLDTDLHRDGIISSIRTNGVDPAGFLSIDDTWSAMLLRPCRDFELDANDLLAWPGEPDP